MCGWCGGGIGVAWWSNLNAMNRIVLMTGALLLAVGGWAQSYSEDFESYTPGDYICELTDEWVTWSGAEGGTEDAQIVTDYANSGSNSIYVSSTSANGGPQDIVLEFGQLIDEGLFEMDMWLLIEEGNGAYFNFQGEEAIGTTWALNMFLNQNGDFNITDSSNEPVMGFSYPIGEWFKVTYVINFTLNNWSVKINDLTIGAFSNSVNQIASLNVYPLNSPDFGGNNMCSMYLDDISWALSDFEITGLNGALTNVEPNTSGIAGQQREVSVVVNNYGLDEITSFDVTASYNGSDQTENVTGINMASLESMEIQFANPITLVEGSNDLTITLSNVNGGEDDNAVDNTSSMTLDPVVPAPGRLVIGEEGTGTWCGWCPRGAVALARMEADYHDFFAGIAVHNGDPMTIDAYDGPFSSIHLTGYPGAVVDRGATIDPLGFEPGFLERIVVPAAATLDVAAEENATTGMLDVSVTYTFQEDINADWRVACVLTEDGVTGTSSGYAQSNYYAGGDNGEMGGYENLPGTVPAADMVYNHVARAISPSFLGGQNLPGTITAGESYTFNFSFAMYAGWNTDEMYIIGMLIEDNGSVNNGGRATYDEAIAADYVAGEVIVGVENLAGPDDLRVFPNPAVDQLTVQFAQPGTQPVQVRNLQGQVVLSQDVRSGAQLDVAALAPGVYVVELPGETVRFVKE